MRLRVHRHDPGASSGLVALIEVAWSPPQPGLLSDMCRRAAEIADVDVVSIYAREKDTLVMRGNHGFPAGAVDHVRLHWGEGITGFVAQHGQPVTVEAADRDRRNKPIAGLGEEKFPVFLGAPVCAQGEAVGVLVFQRRTPRPFSGTELTLALALAAPFSIALERRSRGRETPIAAALRGQGQGGGKVLGAAAMFSTVSSLSRQSRAESTPIGQVAQELAASLDRLAARTPCDLTMAQLTLCDQRFLRHLTDTVANAGLVAGLNRVARDYARHAGGRARDIEDLCFLLATRPALLKPGNILCAARLSWPVLLCAELDGAGGIITEDAADLPGLASTRFPIVTAVTGLSMRIEPGALLAVDGDTGLIEVCPPATTVVAYRRAAS